MITSNRYKNLALIALLTLTWSCKLTQPVKHASHISSPVSFSGQTDSTGIGSLNWKSVFTDSRLSALIDTALANNPDLKIAVQRIEMARSGLMITQGALLPNVSGEVSGGGRKFGDYTMDGVGNYDTNFSENINTDRRIPGPFLPDYFIGLRSSWEIDIWGKLKTRRKAAYNRLLATEKARHTIITGLIAQVASKYFWLVALDNELDIIRKNILLQESAVETVKIQKEGGRANELAVKQFIAQLINTKSLEIETLQKIVAAENQLNLLLGRFPAPILRTKLTEQIFPEQIKSGVPANMLRRRPDIQQAQLEMQAFYSDQQGAQLAFLPSLNITALLGFNAFKGNLLFAPASIAYGAAAGLAAPIINRKGLKAIQKRSEAESKAALFNYNKTILTGFQEVSTGFRKLDNTKKILALKAQEVEVLQQGVAISKDLFLSGYASYLEVILAQRNVLDAELTLTDIKRTQFLAMIELYRALGGGWQQE